MLVYKKDKLQREVIPLSQDKFRLRLNHLDTGMSIDTDFSIKNPDTSSIYKVYKEVDNKYVIYEEFISDAKGKVENFKSAIEFFETQILEQLNEKPQNTQPPASQDQDEPETFTKTPEVGDIVMVNNKYGRIVDAKGTKVKMKNLTKDEAMKILREQRNQKILENTPSMAQGGRTIKIVNDGVKFDKSKYKAIYGDFDKDGTVNIDDANPLDAKKSGKVEQVELKDTFDKLLGVKAELDDIMYDAVDTLDEKAPSDADIYARTKTPYSILKKLVEKRMLDPEKGLTDMIGTTIAVENQKELESVRDDIDNGLLGKVLDRDDYYENPKAGYRAYHYIVEYKNVPVEVQLKTKRMKKLNEVSHDFYKKGTLDAKKLNEVSKTFELADRGDKTALKEVNKLLSNKEQLAFRISKNKMEKGGDISSIEEYDASKVKFTIFEVNVPMSSDLEQDEDNMPPDNEEQEPQPDNVIDPFEDENEMPDNESQDDDNESSSDENSSDEDFEGDDGESEDTGSEDGEAEDSDFEGGDGEDLDSDEEIDDIFGDDGDSTQVDLEKLMGDVLKEIEKGEKLEEVKINNDIKAIEKALNSTRRKIKNQFKTPSLALVGIGKEKIFNTQNEERITKAINKIFT